MKRNDIHRPGALIPEQYVEVLVFCYPGLDGTPGENLDWLTAMRTGEPVKERWFGFGPPPPTWTPKVIRHEKVAFFQKESGGGGCDCCGAHFRFGSVMRHEPTGEHILVGHICAAKIGLMVDFTAGQQMRDRAAERSLRARERAERWSGLMVWARENRSVLGLLATDDPIVKDIRRKLVGNGARWGLSEKQVGLLRALAERKEKPAEKHVPVPFTEGQRAEIEGTVVGVKVHEGDFGNTLKITVKTETPEGSYLLHGTAPRALLENGREALRGSRVKLSAVVQLGREPHFGFFKRPTKAALVDKSEG